MLNVVKLCNYDTYFFLLFRSYGYTHRYRAVLGFSEIPFDLYPFIPFDDVLRPYVAGNILMLLHVLAAHFAAMPGPSALWKHTLNPLRDALIELPLITVFRIRILLGGYRERARN